MRNGDVGGGSLVSSLLRCWCCYGGRAIILVTMSSVTMGCDFETGGVAGDGTSLDQLPVYALADDPLVAVGGADARPEYQFGYVGAAARLTDGRVVVADRMAREIRYYDDQGRHLHTAGGMGEGPGEFSDLGFIQRLAGDTIAAWDGIQRRVSFFGDDGEFDEGVTLRWSDAAQDLQSRFPYPINWGRPYILRGREFIVAGSQSRNPGDGTGVVQDSIALVLFDGPEYVAVLGAFPGQEAFVHERIGTALAYGDGPVLARGEDLVWVGSMRDHVISGVSTAGEIARTIVLPIERRPLPEGALPLGTSSTIPGVRAMYAAMPVPDSLPIFSDAREGTDGRLWVQKYLAPQDSSQEWLAFDDAGDPVGVLRMDAAVELLDVGADFVVVQVTDDFDVPEIQVHRLGSR